MTSNFQFRQTAAPLIGAALVLVVACSLTAGAQDVRQAVVSPSTAAPAAQTPSTPDHSKGTEPSRHQRQEADDAFIAGAKLLDRDDPGAAEVQFEKALALIPDNHDYAQALAIAREHRITELVQKAGKARLLGKPDEAQAYLVQARQLGPENPLVLEHSLPSLEVPALSIQTDPAGSDLAQLAGPIVLQPAEGKRSFHLHSDVQDVLRRISSSYGIRAVLDPSVASAQVRFDIDDVTYQQALPIALQMNGLFAVPLDARSILIAKDSPENRQQFEPVVEETIYVPGMTNEQMNELTNIVKNIFDLKQVTAQNSAGTLVIRAPGTLMQPINLTLADLVDGGSQVMLELKLYSVDTTRNRNTGAQLPQQVGVYNVETAAQNLVSSNQALVNQAIAEGLVPAGSSNTTIALALIASGLVQSTLLSNTIGFFGGGITQSGITLNAVPTFNLALNSTDTRAMDDLQIRVGDGQMGTFRVGSRYPITTSTYTSSASSLNSSALAGVTVNGVSAASLLNTLSTTTIPQIQYEDLGFTLKATPTVQKSGNISMHLDFKIESLTGGSVNGIPILTSRQFVSDVTVANGQTATLLSSVSKSEAGAISGLPGLSEVPGFQTTVADDTLATSNSEIILLVTPHIVRRRSNIYAGPRIALSLPPSQD